MMTYAFSCAEELIRVQAIAFMGYTGVVSDMITYPVVDKLLIPNRSSVDCTLLTMEHTLMVKRG